MRTLSDVLLRVVGITKRFGSVVANENVTFEVKAGEIHSLLGENGAGKTTLMNILYGLYTPDSGYIEIDGKRVNVDSPAVAIGHGVGMVQQHFALVPSFSVAENVLLGTRDWFFRNDPEKIRKIEELVERLGMDLDVRVPVWRLSVGQRQLVEILKLLYRNVRLIILDEPTSALSPGEVERLLLLMESMKSQGKGIVFVTHKLGEVKRVADTVTVMRRGKVVLSGPASNYSVQELAEAMVGSYEPESRLVEDHWITNEEVLRLTDLDIPSDSGTLRIKGLNLSVNAGEVVGIAGVEGNGQKEFVESLMGLRPLLRGKVIIKGESFSHLNPKTVRDYGVAYIPEDRFYAGLVRDMNVMENLILNVYRKPPFSKGWVLNRRRAEENAITLVKRYDIKLASIQQPVKLLSGGNAQKVVVAREFQVSPVLLIAVNPTQGLDVRSTKQVHELIAERARNGTAVLLISTDLQEIQLLSHRVHVFYNGKLSKPLKPDQHSEISNLMLGIGWDDQPTDEHTNAYSKKNEHQRDNGE
ncbi:MAG: ral nucleoside transport system ATP-binding protein [Thermotogota bacterium]|nr:ral nucleoside transport system ATP-binding protein [Thermotogota bacterium]